jgi:hypothetical protein
MNRCIEYLSNHIHNYDFSHNQAQAKTSYDETNQKQRSEELHETVNYETKEEFGIELRMM